jgi:histidinol-phosphate aminotransferase/threonine-phosphate decarboxylase
VKREALTDLRADPTTDDDGHVPHGGAPGEPRLDFSANTNPVVPEGARAVYEDAFDSARSYQRAPTSFREAAASFVGCDPENVVPTAGGLAAIRLAIQTTVGPADSVAIPSPGFGEYAREVRLQGGDPVAVPADSLAAIDPAAYELVVVCAPNNPTGTAYPHQDLKSLAARSETAGTALLVDEAFRGFTDQPSLAGHDEVIVARSLTKLFGLPGLRAGFAVATGQARDRLRTAAMPWNLGTPAAVTGAYCLRQAAFVASTKDRVATERARIRERLRTRFSVSPSNAPYLLVDCGSDAATDAVIGDLAESDIAVRDARSFDGLNSHLRIAVRLPAENDQLLEALDV